MKAYEIAKFGFDGLQMVEREMPKPGPGEVLLRMKAVSLNYRELLVVQGGYNPRLAFPTTPASDGVGEVAAVGEGVTSVNVGDRVATMFFEHWDSGELSDEGARTAVGAGYKGVFAEYVCVREGGVSPVPDFLTDAEASTLPCAALTAWHGMFEQAKVRPGSTVLTLGTGGVSLFALQFAAMAGARVIITSSSDEKLARARELGAGETINYREHEDWEKIVRKLTAGRGVDHVIEVGGAGTFPKSLRAVRRGGVISLIGVLAGLGTVDPLPIFMYGIRVNGIYVGSRAMFRSMVGAVEQHQLHPVVDRVFEFAEARTAYEHLASGQHFGKLVIKIAD
jgi:NADPH:quinone reductase-like Zn-dependent oxidoreductase